MFNIHYQLELCTDGIPAGVILGLTFSRKLYLHIFEETFAKITANFLEHSRKIYSTIFSREFTEIFAKICIKYVISIFGAKFRENMQQFLRKYV